MKQGLNFGKKFLPKKTTTTPLGISCPLCHVGEMVKREGGFGVLIGCSRFPMCDYKEKKAQTLQQKLDSMTDDFLKAHGCRHLVKKT